jgi:hypothetical protein
VFTLQQMMQTAWQWEQNLLRDEKLYNSQLGDLN